MKRMGARLYQSNMGNIESKMENMQKIMRVLTHDLRNPLLNIHALVQELDYSVRKQHGLDDDVVETLDMLKESANRMDDMIVATNEMYHCMFDELEIESIDMHELFLRCFANLKLAEEGISLDCAALPKVDADPLMIQRVVHELLSNARKAIATQPLDTARKIRISAVEERGMVWFCVEDSGCGFDEDEMEQVFEPFFSGQRFAYGSGMGLARAKAWVEHHGGSIKIENVAQHAVVGFSLPKSA